MFLGQGAFGGLGGAWGQGKALGGGRGGVRRGGGRPGGGRRGYLGFWGRGGGAFERAGPGGASGTNGGRAVGAGVSASYFLRSSRGRGFFIFFSGKILRGDKEGFLARKGGPGFDPASRPRWPGGRGGDGGGPGGGIFPFSRVAGGTFQPQDGGAPGGGLLREGGPGGGSHLVPGPGAGVQTRYGELEALRPPGTPTSPFGGGEGDPAPANRGARAPAIQSQSPTPGPGGGGWLGRQPWFLGGWGAHYWAGGGARISGRGGPPGGAIGKTHPPFAGVPPILGAGGAG